MPAEPPAAPSLLTATYRLQLHAGFDFDAAAALVPYLKKLGISHLYCSPVLAAQPGSRHGYDVIDPGRVNPELGGDAGRRRLLAAARRHGLGVILDVVPNHVSVARPVANPWWWDVLRTGRDSPYATFFDIDWSRPRLLLPVLGEARDLDRLELGEHDGQPALIYFEHCFPLAPGTEGGADARAVHDRQHYELVDWRRGAAELGYRRFFDVTELAGVRVERLETFEATHALVLSWLRAGEVDGLRVDHPDGLADPAGYLAGLRAAAPHAWILVEKILESGEALPCWPVDGTTGYDALALVDGIFIDQSAERAFTELCTRVTGEQPEWDELVHECKLAAATGTLAAETARLARLGADPAALAEALACFPVYRSYLPDSGQLQLSEAIEAAARRRPDLATPLRELHLRLADPADELSVRFQQTSGMVMAKGVEDTAFYRYHRLTALNEVGGDPGRFGLSPEQFHAGCAQRERAWPRSMTTLSTHDTKRSSDVRARLSMLSEVPAEWADLVSRLHGVVRPYAGGIDGGTEYLMHQSALGAWPVSADRLADYLEKASREAKLHTSWTEPNDRYDRDLRDLATRATADRDYIEALEGFLDSRRPAERATIAARAVLQLTMPGIPDIYQGDEVVQRSLVDPDNRRPLDPAALARFADPKQQVIQAVLAARRDGLLAPGAGYEPLETLTAHALAYRRGPDVVVAVGRLLLQFSRAGSPATGVPLPAATDGWYDRIGGARYDRSVPLGVLAGQGGVLLVRV